MSVDLCSGVSTNNTMDIHDLLTPDVNISIGDTPIVTNSDTSGENLCNGSSNESPRAVSSSPIVIDSPKSTQNADVDGEEQNESWDSNKENDDLANLRKQLETFTDEEKPVYAERFKKGEQAVQFLRHHCSACNVHLGSNPTKYKEWYVHPLLGVMLCKNCFEFYGSGEFKKDEDGSEMYCRWCGQGGKVLCCAKCEYVFCQKCIRTNFNKKTLDMIKDSDDWLCFKCNPEQLMNLRISFKALYQFALSKMKECNGTDSDRNLLDVDFSLCCKHKSQQTVKKRRGVSPDLTYDPYEDESVVKKKKINPAAKTKAQPAVKLNADETDEVVCTPDVNMLMMQDEDESSSNTSTPTKPPPLKPITIAPRPPEVVLFSKSKTQVNPTQIRFVPTSSIVPTTSFIMPSNIVSPVLVGNMTQPQNIADTNVQLVQPNSQTQTLVKGQKYEWLDQAEQLITTINCNLMSNVTALSLDQYAVRNVQDLANIHNSLQTILSSCTNSLIQVRKNLRTNFIKSLESLKYERPRQQPQVVINLDPDPSPAKIAVRNYLKVKSVSQLNTNCNNIIDITDEATTKRDSPQNCIEILDDSKEEKETKPQEDNKRDAGDDGSSKKGEEDSNNEDVIDMETDPITRLLIKRALLDSTLERIVDENLKLKCNFASPEELKKMLSVRVLLEPNYGPGTPKTLKNQSFKPMTFTEIEEIEDFEDILTSSIVSKGTSNDIKLPEEKRINGEVGNNNSPVVREDKINNCFNEQVTGDELQIVPTEAV